MTGEKCYTTKNASPYNYAKKGNQANNKRKTEKSEKEKSVAKRKQRKKSIKGNCHDNYEKKRFIQSFKAREQILKLKIKIRNIQ